MGEILSMEDAWWASLLDPRPTLYDRDSPNAPRDVSPGPVPRS